MILNFIYVRKRQDESYNANSKSLCRKIFFKVKKRINVKIGKKKLEKLVIGNFW